MFNVVGIESILGLYTKLVHSGHAVLLRNAPFSLLTHMADLVQEANQCQFAQ